MCDYVGPGFTYLAVLGNNGKKIPSRSDFHKPRLGPLRLKLAPLAVAVTTRRRVTVSESDLQLVPVTYLVSILVVLPASANNARPKPDSEGSRSPSTYGTHLWPGEYTMQRLR